MQVFITIAKSMNFATPTKIKEEKPIVISKDT